MPTRISRTPFRNSLNDNTYRLASESEIINVVLPTMCASKYKVNLRTVNRTQGKLDYNLVLFSYYTNVKCFNYENLNVLRVKKIKLRGDAVVADHRSQVECCRRRHASNTVRAFRRGPTSTVACYQATESKRRIVYLRCVRDVPFGNHTDPCSCRKLIQRKRTLSK